MSCIITRVWPLFGVSGSPARDGRPSTMRCIIIKYMLTWPVAGVSGSPARKRQLPANCMHVLALATAGGACHWAGVARCYSSRAQRHHPLGHWGHASSRSAGASGPLADAGRGRCALPQPGACARASPGQAARSAPPAAGNRASAPSNLAPLKVQHGPTDGAGSEQEHNPRARSPRPAAEPPPFRIGDWEVHVRHSEPLVLVTVTR